MNCFIRSKALILLFLLCSIFKANGQGEDYQWHFGTGHHIDFNTVPPTYANNSNMVTWESSASISDAQGNLLFYTMGCRIWDRNGNEMPNATGLKGNGSSVTGTSWMGSGHDCVQIVPHPANPYQYYVFSSSSFEDMLDTVYYHMVDMRLNGGLGDVIPASKNTVLLNAGNNGLKESITAAQGDCGQFWLVVVTSIVHNSAFYAYKIDESGLHPNPVISTPNNMGAATGLTRGMVRIAPSGQFAFKSTDQGLMRTDFNKSTGQFSNFEIVPNSAGQSYMEYAPNGRYLYSGGGPMKQYDLYLSANLAQMSANAADLNVNGIVGTRLKLGPDNKIYTIAATPSSTVSYIYRIEQPDLPGTASNFVQFTAIPPTYTIVSLGANTLVRPPRDTIHHKDTLYLPCKGNAPVTLSAIHQGTLSTFWSDSSSGNTITVNEEGTYWADAYSSACLLYRDSFIVLGPPEPPALGNDTILCYGKSLHLTLPDNRYEHITWSDGSNNPDFTISAAGTYYVTVTSGPCSFTDTIQVSYRPQAILEIVQSDTTICKGSVTQLEARTNMGSTVYWSTGQTGPSITIDRKGNYQAHAANECGQLSDAVLIEDMDCNCRPIVPNAFTPNGDGRNDIFMPVFNPDCDALYYELKIYNRYGQLVYMTNRKGTGWDGTYSNNRLADAGVYFYTISLSNRYGDTDKQLLKGDITLVR